MDNNDLEEEITNRPKFIPFVLLTGPLGKDPGAKTPGISH